jgi:hypothetical protein
VTGALIGFVSVASGNYILEMLMCCFVIYLHILLGILIKG